MPISAKKAYQRDALLIEGLQVCSKCELAKPLDEFYHNCATVSGRIGACIPCKREADKRGHASRYHGIHYWEYQAYLTQPCWGCGAPSTHLDHNHDTGKIRGGMCQRCNNGMGFFNDDPDFMERVAAELRRRNG